MENYQDTLAQLILMTGVVLLVFIIAKYTYLVKKAVIEKGLTPKTNSGKIHYIDIACIMGSLGVGLMISTIYSSMNLTGDTLDMLIWGTIFIFGAIGLFAAHILRRKFESRQ
jgi:hypothetical protein